MAAEYKIGRIFRRKGSRKGETNGCGEWPLWRGGRAAAASSEWKGIGAQGAQWYCAVSVFLSLRDSDWRLAGEPRHAAVGMNIFRFNRHLAHSGRQEEVGDIKRCRISPSAKN